MRLFIPGLNREEVIAMPHGLDENERAVEHQRDDTGEDQLRRAEKRTGRAGGDVRQHQGERGERGQHRQRGAGAVKLKSLLVMTRPAPEQAHPDDAVAHDHHGGVHGVAREPGLLARRSRHHRHEQQTLEHWLRRPETTWEQLCSLDPGLAQRSEGVPAETIEQVVLEVKYSGYVARQAAQVERFQRLESKPIPAHFDYGAVPQLRAEAREKLNRIRPTSIGQAGRISGISPADLAVLLLYLE